MRNIFVNEIQKEAERNKNLIFLTGDLGYSVFENFQKNCPEQFFNVGIAEQNMAGMASGLALDGKKVFIYSIVPFSVMRCYEQIRDDICYHNLDVNIIGVGGGFAYGSAGFSHHALEDLAIMRVLPNMKIICPCDPAEASALAKEILQKKGPFYIRLNKGGEKQLWSRPEKFEIGRCAVLKEGKDIAIFATGAIVSEAITAAEILEHNGISTEVISLHTVKPLDTNLILERMRNKTAIFSLEEHSLIGGLGSAIAEIIVKYEKNALFHSFGVDDKFSAKVGSQDYLRRYFGLDGESLAAEINKIIQSRQKMQK